jgi:hypothetical protein
MKAPSQSIWITVERAVLKDPTPKRRPPATPHTANSVALSSVPRTRACRDLDKVPN